MFSLSKIGEYLRGLILPSEPRTTPLIIPFEAPKGKSELLTPEMVIRGDIYTLDMSEN